MLLHVLECKARVSTSVASRNLLTCSEDRVTVPYCSFSRRLFSRKCARSFDYGHALALFCMRLTKNESRPVAIESCGSIFVFFNKNFSKERPTAPSHGNKEKPCEKLYCSVLIVTLPRRELGGEFDTIERPALLVETVEGECLHIFGGTRRSFLVILESFVQESSRPAGSGRNCHFSPHTSGQKCSFDQNGKMPRPESAKMFWNHPNQ